MLEYLTQLNNGASDYNPYLEENPVLLDMTQAILAYYAGYLPDTITLNDMDMLYETLYFLDLYWFLSTDIAADFKNVKSNMDIFDEV